MPPPVPPAEYKRPVSVTYHGLGNAHSAPWRDPRNSPSHLGSVRYEDRARQIPGESTGEVDYADAEGAGQLLQVPHEEVLDAQGDEQVEYPGNGHARSGSRQERRQLSLFAIVSRPEGRVDVDLPGVEENRGEQPVELVRPFRVEERNHAADVVEAFDLRAEGGLLVEVAVDEVAVLLGRDAAHPVDPDAAGMPYHLADHVLRHLVHVPADRERVLAVAAALTAQS